MITFARKVFAFLAVASLWGGESGARDGGRAPRSDCAQDVEARVTATLASRESIAYVTVVVTFENRGVRRCRVSGYAVAWDGGRKTAVPRAFVLGPSATVERRLRVTPADGDLDALLARKTLRIERLEVSP